LGLIGMSSEEAKAKAASTGAAAVEIGITGQSSAEVGTAAHLA
jgi:hypothetical protein